LIGWLVGWSVCRGGLVEGKRRLGNRSPSLPASIAAAAAAFVNANLPWKDRNQLGFTEILLQSAPLPALTPQCPQSPNHTHTHAFLAFSGTRNAFIWCWDCVFIILGVNDFIFGHPIEAVWVCWLDPFAWFSALHSALFCIFLFFCFPAPFTVWSSDLPGHPLSRLIALISSDSDYCCLRIVQLMCELRHHLRFLFLFIPP